MIYCRLQYTNNDLPSGGGRYQKKRKYDTKLSNVYNIIMYLDYDEKLY